MDGVLAPLAHVSTAGFTYHVWGLLHVDLTPLPLSYIRKKNTTSSDPLRDDLVDSKEIRDHERILSEMIRDHERIHGQESFCSLKLNSKEILPS